MSYEPTIIIDYEDLANVIENTKKLEEYKDYGKSFKGEIKNTLIKYYINEREERDGCFPVILKGVRLMIIDVEFTSSNKAMRALLDDLDIPFCTNN